MVQILILNKQDGLGSHTLFDNLSNDKGLTHIDVIDNF